MGKKRIIDLSKIVKIRRFENAVVFYEKDTYHVCESGTEIPDKSDGFIEVTLKAKDKCD